jgi:uncharacterized membrane protein
MRDSLIAYAVTLIALTVLDFAWLSLMMGPLYQRTLGSILSDSVNYPAAIAFYLIYAAGTVFFVVRPALESGSWVEALLRGAALGFFAYATYDLTSYATLKHWSLRISLLDMSWGAVLTAVAAAAATAVALRLEK